MPEGLRVLLSGLTGLCRRLLSSDLSCGAGLQVTAGGCSPQGGGRVHWLVLQHLPGGHTTVQAGQGTVLLHVAKCHGSARPSPALRPPPEAGAASLPSLRWVLVPWAAPCGRGRARGNLLVLLCSSKGCGLILLAPPVHIALDATCEPQQLQQSPAPAHGAQKPGASWELVDGRTELHGATQLRLLEERPTSASPGAPGQHLAPSTCQCSAHTQPGQRGAMGSGAGGVPDPSSLCHPFFSCWGVALAALCPVPDPGLP